MLFIDHQDNGFRHSALTILSCFGCTIAAAILNG